MAVTWLRALPPWLRDTLDWAEFAPDRPELGELRAAVAARTGHLIMAYRLVRAEPRRGTRSLCRLIEPAALTPADTAALAAAEDRARRFDACLVAYRNPLTLRPGLVPPPMTSTR